MGIQVETKAKRLMATAVASLGLLLVGLTPEVMRAQKLFDLPTALSYQSGQLNAEIRVNPLMRRLLGYTIQLEIPSEIQLEATEFAGHIALGSAHHFLPLESERQSSPELPSSELRSSKPQLSELQPSVSIPMTALLERLDPMVDRTLRQLRDRYGLPSGLTAKQLNEIFHYQISGTGTLTENQEFQTEQIRREPTGVKPKTSAPTSFEFTYDSQTERLQTQNLDLLMLNRCGSRTCIGELAGDLDFDLSVKGLLQVSEALDLKLPASVRRLLRLAMVRRFASLDFAAGQFNAELKTQPHHGSATQVSVMTQGHFGLHARRSTLPWSLLFSVPTARSDSESNFD